MASASSQVVNAQPQHGSFAVAATSATSLTSLARVPEHRRIGRLAVAVGHVVVCLETASPDAQTQVVVGECNAAIEVYLELQRDDLDRDALAATAKDDLKRLARLLTVVDRTDVPFVLRQIRRVLGRLDPLGV
jgi:hypothetical protein